MAARTLWRKWDATERAATATRAARRSAGDASEVARPWVATAINGLPEHDSKRSSVT